MSITNPIEKKLSNYYEKQQFEPKTFDKLDKLAELYGTQASRIDKRRFERYWNSDQRLADERNFLEAENQRWLEHEKAERKKYLDVLDQKLAGRLGITTDQFKSLQKLSSPELGIALRNIKNNASLTPQPLLAPRAQSVPSAANNTKVTNTASSLKSPQPETSTIAKLTSNPIVQNLATETRTEPRPEKSTLTAYDFSSNPHWRNHHFLKNGVLNIEGKEYPFMVTTGLLNNPFGVENDQTYVIHPQTGLIRAVYEDFTGMPRGQWAENSEWITPSWMVGSESEWIKANPIPFMMNDNSLEYQQWLQKYELAKNTGFKKQGGKMNRIKYFQQGGEVAQPDIQQQVVQLVQAAMQGDQKATETVSKIMEAAKTGDPQATQIAQMIQEVAKQMQGQATLAKWGSKLEYIKHLKYAKGGKTCAPCQQSTKVEMKKCGGKKAKKKYFGGWI